MNIEKLSIKAIIEGLRSGEITPIFIKRLPPYTTRKGEYVCKNRKRVFDEIELVLKGTITGKIRGKEIDISNGTFFWLPAHVEHSLSWPVKTEYYALDFQLQKDNHFCTLDKPYFTLPGALHLNSLFELIREKIVIPSLYQDYSLSCILTLILVSVFARYAVIESKSRGGIISTYIQNKIIQYVAENITEHPQPRDIARIAGMSYDYFSRSFKNTFGISPKTWLLTERMRTAGQLLIETDFNISDIAIRIGYIDPGLFARQFKKIFGISPIKFRKKYR